jgi:hypothetical protein
MSDPSPNCTIALSLFDADTVPRFSYHCTGSSSGWQVQSDGSIHPPSKSRIIQIRVGYPSGALFTGFQLVTNPDNFIPPGTEPHWYAETGLEGAILEPFPFPPSPGTDVQTLTLDLTNVNVTSGLLFYQLAVNGHWDEPKVYDDGSI